ncbi:MAG: type II toxin-antitoxin system RelE/ParE family toxin [Rhodobacteraceae bacterium]|nr:type II toxin-antitoxin system RelE/ParE family toxin [Paracoccaceae bacterium]
MQSYDLTLAAETDLRDIWRYTYKTWGLEQAEKYFDQIEACCEAVGDLLADYLDTEPQGWVW